MTEITLWNDQTQLAQVKEQYGKGLTVPEWNLFLTIGRATGLNPFLREIYAVKYGGNPASIFIGRDGYRRSAQQHKEYEWHTCDAVYSNDQFEVQDGKVAHKFDLKNRGELIGAYCLVKRKSAEVPMYNFVEFKEYNTKKSIWLGKPATMIKKVAEAQGLRAAFQELFAGTHEESEDFEPQKSEERESIIQAIEVCETYEELEKLKPEIARVTGGLSLLDQKNIINLCIQKKNSLTTKDEKANV